MLGLSPIETVANYRVGQVKCTVFACVSISQFLKYIYI